MRSVSLIEYLPTPCLSKSVANFLPRYPFPAPPNPPYSTLPSFLRSSTPLWLELASDLPLNLRFCATCLVATIDLSTISGRIMGQ